MTPERDPGLRHVEELDRASRIALRVEEGQGAGGSSARPKGSGSRDLVIVAGSDWKGRRGGKKDVLVCKGGIDQIH